MLSDLTAALGGDGRTDFRGGAALRIRVRLQPIAGDGARVMPSTYDIDGKAGYITEQRRLGGVEVPCVLIDSQASQSNRLEATLADSMSAGAIRIPDITVDLAEFGVSSALTLPHRLFDAMCEDALLDGARFGSTPQYDALAGVIHRGVAGPLVERFPVGLLLGCWASRKSNPQGSTRIARAITSEIIAYDTLLGQRAKSRIDPRHVSAGVRLVDGDGDQARFAIAPEKPRGSKRPSEFGYGNVTPSVADHGGITMRHAEQQTVVALTSLRSVCAGSLADGPATPTRDLAARELLVLLALAMLELQVDAGWDLRSGCQLVPDGEPTVQVIGRLGQVLAEEPLVGLGTVEALAAATARAKQVGLDWDVPPIELIGAPEQLDLLRRSLGFTDEPTPA
jgi:CRISPR-associated protein Csb1